MRHLIQKIVCIGWTMGILLTVAQSAFAQWSRDPDINTPVCTAANNQFVTDSISDGAGGAIIIWYDYRNGDADIYAQRIDAGGNALWTANGVAICTAANIQVTARAVSDGSGGAIIIWEDYRNDLVSNSDIYAQRIDSGGNTLWATNGVPICTALGQEHDAQLVSDGAGGAIITWEDDRNGTDYDIYAQRINSSGVVQWTTDGVAICAATNDQQYPQLVGDGAGGAIITWEDYRTGGGDIYAQRINSSGIVQWTADGVAVCTAANAQNGPYIVVDSTGGTIITWYDFRDGSNYDIYAQRINSSGVVQWFIDGTQVCTEASYQSDPQIISDASGGAFIVWTDSRGGAGFDIYAQRINSSGAAQWTVNGIAICTAPNGQGSYQMISDSTGGMIVTWRDYRNGSGLTNADIYAQRVNGSGVVQWAANGVAISTAANHQESPFLVSDGSSGTIIAWTDYRNGTSNLDIYAQRVLSTGVLAGSPASPTSLFATATSTAQINLQWTDNSTTEDGFKIERSPDGSSFSEIATVGVNGTTTSDTGLTASTTYYYRVRAYNSFGNSAYTNVSSATTSPPAPTPPTAPSGLTVTVASSTQINLSWTDNSTDENGFKIERSADGSSFSQIATAGANLTTYSDNGLSVLTAYYYRVRAYNSAGDSSYTSTASATTPGPPPAPSNLTATAVSASQVDLAWTDNATTEDGFKIERSTDGNNFSEIATVLSNITSYNNTDLSASTTYYFRLRAYNSYGHSSYTTTASATTQGAGGGGGGGCGSVGLDLMWPLGVLWLMRRRRTKAN